MHLEYRSYIFQLSSNSSKFRHRRHVPKVGSTKINKRTKTKTRDTWTNIITPHPSHFNVRCKQELATQGRSFILSRIYLFIYSYHISRFRHPLCRVILIKPFSRGARQEKPSNSSGSYTPHGRLRVSLSDALLLWENLGEKKKKRGN